MARFDYAATNEAGRRITGSLEAASDQEAFASLRRQNLRPVRLQLAGGKASSGRVRLTPSLVGELLAELAALLDAGASMKNALAVIAKAGSETGMGAAARALSEEIGKGRPLEEAFAAVLGPRYASVPALVAAGEAAGALPAALETIADTIERDLEITEQVAGALSYPAFVLLMTLASLLMIVLLVVPALAPVIDAAGGETSAVMRGLLAVSRLLTEHPLVWLGLGVAALAGWLAAWRTGLLDLAVQRLLLDGPVRLIVRGIVYGGFARTLGQLLTARTPASEAIRLAVGSVPLAEAARRLEGLPAAIGGGASLSEALAGVSSLPATLGQMAMIGEETGALGKMLDRAGRLEQARALRRIKAQTKWLGPALIIVLGVMIGILMSGLLSGVSALGDTGIE